MQSPGNDHDFYLRSMQVLKAAGIPFLVGGAFALRAYAHIERDTKDFDVMVKRADVDRALELFRGEGFRAGIVYPHWIAKVHHGAQFIDIIYNSGNGVCPVDDQWFEHGPVATVFGEEVRICPAEEMIWQKAFIMERERFDGADIAHLVRGCAGELDWPRLLRRFAGHEAVLLAHLLLVRYIYPGPDERRLVPHAVIDQLFEAAGRNAAAGEAGRPNLCQGTFLSRAQYLVDVETWNYADARVAPPGPIPENELQIWTSAIDEAQTNVR